MDNVKGKVIKLTCWTQWPPSFRTCCADYNATKDAAALMDKWCCTGNMQPHLITKHTHTITDVCLMAAVSTYSFSPH